jgi:hypothetical protein
LFGEDRKWLSTGAPRHVDKILKGAKPAELPVEQPALAGAVSLLRRRVSFGEASDETTEMGNPFDSGSFLNDRCGHHILPNSRS